MPPGPTSQDSTMMETAAMPSSSSAASQNEAFVLLANGTKGAAAVGLVQQVLEAPGVHVFGELLDHPNIRALSSSPPADGPGYFRLLEIFAFGTYSQYLAEEKDRSLPPLTPQMAKKLRLLTVASMATEARMLKYSRLLEELKMGSVRELEDLIIEGANSNVVRGKLDQKALHFEVDYTMARDIKKEEVKDVIRTLEDWCSSCNGMLKCLENEATRADAAKTSSTEQKKQIEQKVREIRGQLKQSHSNEGGSEDPDSRMDLDRQGGPSSSADVRRDKKAAKSKGQRGPGGKGGGGFWQK